MPTSLYSGREWLEFDAVAPTLVQQAQVLAQTVPPPAKTCPPHTAEAAGYLLKALCQSFAWRHWITTRQATGPLAIGIKSLRQHKNIIENYKRKQYVIDFEEGRPFTTAIAHLKQFRFFLRELHLHQSGDHKPLLAWIQHHPPPPLPYLQHTLASIQPRAWQTATDRPHQLLRGVASESLATGPPTQYNPSWLSLTGWQMWEDTPPNDYQLSPNEVQLLHLQLHHIANLDSSLLFQIQSKAPTTWAQHCDIPLPPELIARLL